MTAKVFNLRKARKNTLTIARELCYNEIEVIVGGSIFKDKRPTIALNITEGCR